MKSLSSNNGSYFEENLINNKKRPYYSKSIPSLNLKRRRRRGQHYFDENFYKRNSPIKDLRRLKPLDGNWYGIILNSKNMKKRYKLTMRFSLKRNSYEIKLFDYHNKLIVEKNQRQRHLRKLFNLNRNGELTFALGITPPLLHYFHIKYYDNDSILGTVVEGGDLSVKFLGDFILSKTLNKE